MSGSIIRIGSYRVHDILHPHSPCIFVCALICSEGPDSDARPLAFAPRAAAESKARDIYGGNGDADTEGPRDAVAHAVLPAAAAGRTDTALAGRRSEPGQRSGRPARASARPGVAVGYLPTAMLYDLAVGRYPPAGNARRRSGSQRQCCAPVLRPGHVGARLRIRFASICTAFLEPVN